MTIGFVLLGADLLRLLVDEITRRYSGNLDLEDRTYKIMLEKVSNAPQSYFEKQKYWEIASLFDWKMRELLRFGPNFIERITRVVSRLF